MTYKEVIKYLEGLTIMPKTMPGLEKIRQAVTAKSWFKNLDPKKIITVAGTNGKGTTAAALEALLISANQKVGLYTSPHLVSTTERIRLNGQDISEKDFIHIFLNNKDLIEKFQLSHFESLTLMAADFFFSQNLDYTIWEVGLGGLYDATNIFPNHYAIITKIGIDHENILGRTIEEIAKNKFGIIKPNAVVIHHEMDPKLKGLVTVNCQWIPAEKNEPFKTNLIGPRAQENIATAVTAFKQLGFDFEKHQAALENINWPGRMQKINWPGLQAPLYLSGDHNPQGIDSLVDILKDFKYETLHVVVGIGTDKSVDEMLHKILSLPRVKLYLTETPFKGLKIRDYPEFAIKVALQKHAEVENILNSLKAGSDDLVIVSGSLYLVGKVLSKVR